jgi:predicted dehydrogenase
VETKVKIGLVGAGNIAPQYIRGCRAFPILEIAACADMDMRKAEAVAQEFDLKAVSVDALLADPEIQIVVNLTIPQAHAEVSLAALAAGKHVHSEKPLAVSREDGKRIIDAAHTAGLRVGCAPDTFLGGGLQTCRKLIDDGVIGEPVAATAFMPSHGPESWHPNPTFFYQTGAGPMFDMGPYYLTAMINLMGGIHRVTGSTRISFPERTITSKEHYGEKIPVETPTHIAGVLDFDSGAVATIITSFDIWAAHLPRIEIYGSEGSLSVPDPNIFGGTVQVYRPGTKEWEDVPLTHSAEVGRGIGVADLAYGLVSGRPHRASGELAYHVLDVMHAFEESSASNHHIDITSSVPRPAPLPVGLPLGQLDA